MPVTPAEPFSSTPEGGCRTAPSVALSYRLKKKTSTTEKVQEVWRVSLDRLIEVEGVRRG